MRENLVIFILLALLIATSGSVASSPGVQFTTSFESTTIGVTNSVDKISLDIEDADMTTRYIDDEEPVSLDVSVTNVNESKTINRQYDYEVPENGKISVNRNIKLNEFDSTDFPLDRRTELDIEFAVNHPSFEEQVRKNTVSIVEGVDNTSCDTIKQTDSDATSGVYTIDPDGDGGVSGFEVYCEMNEDGGGWIKLETGGYMTQQDGDQWGCGSRNNFFIVNEGSDWSEANNNYYGYDGRNPWPFGEVNQFSSENDFCSGDNIDQFGFKINDLGVDTKYTRRPTDWTKMDVDYYTVGGGVGKLSEAQENAIRDQITQISEETEMMAITADDDSCTYNGEVQVALDDGTTELLTTWTTSTEDTEWGKFHTGSTDTTTGDSVGGDNHLRELSAEKVLPPMVGFYNGADCSGPSVHIDWGYEKGYILVK